MKRSRNTTPQIYRTDDFVIRTKPLGKARLSAVIAAHADVYNWGLRIQIQQYELFKDGKVDKGYLSLFDMQKLLTEYRKTSFTLMQIPVIILRTALEQLDEAFQGFFRRHANGETPGFPRKRNESRHDSFSFPWDGKMVTGTGRSARLRIPGQKTKYTINLYRQLRGTPKKVTIHRDKMSRFTVHFNEEIGPVPAKVELATIPDEKKVGIDLGLKSLIATSDGKTIPNKRHFQKLQKQLGARQRYVEKGTQKGSNGRRKARRMVAKTHRKIKNQRKDFMFKLAKTIVTAYQLIALEDLNIKGLARSALGKYVNYVGWGILVRAIKCKAEEAGALVVEVNPRYTSQECSKCGDVKPKELRQRVHNCALCGLTLDRDVNAARVILARGIATLGMSVEEASQARRDLVKARRSEKKRTAALQ